MVSATSAFAALFVAICKYLPNTTLHWKDVLVGAVITAALFIFVKAIGVYISLVEIESLFGAAGSLVIVIAWVYYSAQIFSTVPCSRTNTR